MIKEFVKRWEENKAEIQRFFEEKHPSSYKDIVENVIKNITNDDYERFAPDPERVHQIDDGDYQGTLLFVIAEKGYQPDDYYFVKVGYGSCSGCDTLEGIRNYDDEKPSEEQIREYMLLSLHIVQGLKSMQETENG